LRVRTHYKPGIFIPSTKIFKNFDKKICGGMPKRNLCRATPKKIPAWQFFIPQAAKGAEKSQLFAASSTTGNEVPRAKNKGLISYKHSRLTTLLDGINA
jgi:hypothetical protein